MKPSPDANENISPFEKLLAALAAGGVDFAVAGGVAVILNGYPRLTPDVDILVGQGDENIRKLLNCLAQWGEGWARELKVEDFSPQPGAIRVTEEFDLDIFTQMDGKPLDYFRPRLRHMRTGLVTIPDRAATVRERPTPPHNRTQPLSRPRPSLFNFSFFSPLISAFQYFSVFSVCLCGKRSHPVHPVNPVQ